HFSDLANQLRLFIDDDRDLGMRPEAYIRKLGGERQFLQAHSETFIRSIAAFDKSDCIEDWNELMKLFLVRRTRTFIKENYAKTDPTNGRRYLEFPDKSRSYFPDRLPKALKFKAEPGDQYSRLYSERMIEMMESLSLPRYGLTAFLNEDKAREASVTEKAIIENLSRAGTQQMGFCKSTFFKRIDSCGFSFLLTLSRHILRNMVFIYALDNKLRLPISDENQLPDDFIDDDDINGITLGDDVDNDATNPDDGLPKISTDLDEYMRRAEEYYNFIVTKSNVGFIDSKYFKRTLKQKLKKDCETLIEMIRLCGDWVPATDQKLNLLHDMLTDLHKEEKVVIFTQYSDTAKYIYRQLRRRGLDALSVVTGGCANPTAEVEKFSPISNDRPDITPDRQYRVIIATDVLSEGQNLQDSHIIVNFDLPWAIIRLIQRAGRVDRIGQKAESIYCYSFFPADGVEKIISLRSRLNDRINANANIIGSDEIFFEGNEKNLRDMFNEKAGALDDDDDGDVDLSSQAFQIWKNATDANPRLKEIIPQLQNMVYSTKAVGDAASAGVITYARTHNDFDVLTWLAPDGSVMSHSQKKILQAMQCSISDPCVEPIANHHELVCQAVEQVERETADPTTAGILGNRFSTRYRLVDLLDHYYRQDTNIFFNADDKEDLKLAIDDIYNYPLLDSAKLTIGQMLRRNQNNDEIVQYVLDLRKSGALCRLPAEENTRREPAIICSLGMKNLNN
ncbi:MAG: SWF/SNF helicase family protein, partial [Muribaculaceae bacterium]|nr:SWF/SNF helicase family protein [Muribaculaceae bacterium]